MNTSGLAGLHMHLGASVATEILWSRSLAHEQGIALPVKDYSESSCRSTRSTC